MKAEYADDRDTHNNNAIIGGTYTTPTTIPPTSSPSIPNMFSTFHQQPPKSQPPAPQPAFHHPQFLHHHFQLSSETSQHPHNRQQQQQQQTSEEADSPTPTPAATTTPSTPPTKRAKNTQNTASTAQEDGATIEVVRRPRGRPPGSKNKPKPPVVITREPESPSMSPYILEIPGGSDIIESLTRFTRRRGIGICVLTGSGAVANITLKQPCTAAPGGTVTFHGRFDILSISAVLMSGGGGLGSFGGSTNNNSSSNNNKNGVFSISLAGPQGQIVGGRVVGALIAAGTVFVIAAGFCNPTYHRLTIGDEDEEDRVHYHVSGGNHGMHHQQQSQHSGSSPGGSGSGGGGGEGGGCVVPPPLGLYSSCHLGSDVIWAPTPARPVASQPPPPPY